MAGEPSASDPTELACPEQELVRRTVPWTARYEMRAVPARGSIPVVDLRPGTRGKGNLGRITPKEGGRPDRGQHRAAEG